MKENLVRVVDSNFDRLQARKGTAAKNNSQMDRLTAMLAAAGTPEASAEEKLEAATKRHAELLKLRAKLVRLTAAMSALYTSNRSEQMKLLTSGQRAVEKLIAEGLPTGMSKVVKACLNEMTSMREGVYVGASTDKKSLTFMSIAQAVVAVDEQIEKTKTRAAKLKREITATGNDLEDDTEEVIRRNKQDSAKMPNLANKDWGVARVAVLPVPMKSVPADVLVPALKRAGFSADNMAGYASIHNQLVVGINNARLEPGTKSLQAVKQVIPKLEKAMGQRLALISEQASGHKGIAWYWVMPEREMALMAKAFPGGQLLLRSWGFSF